MPRATLYRGNALEVLRRLPTGAVRCCVTSPPYWGLRDYGHAGQLGLERTPEEYVARMVEVFREVRRVLADDGTLWLNLGDSYGRQGGRVSEQPRHWDGRKADPGAMHGTRLASDFGGKPKNLVGIPWRVAFALQADGWYLRSDVVWSKPNPMPESVRDRPTKAHEYVFLLSKAERYFYDAAAIAEPVSEATVERLTQAGHEAQVGSARGNGGARADRPVKALPPRFGGTKYGDSEAPEARTKSGKPYIGGSHRNARSVWTIATQGYRGAHFAVMPEELARRCILAGSAPGDTVLDPFGGSGTVAAVAVGRLGRAAIHIDLNQAYHALAIERIGPMLCEVAE